jgi:Type II secretion system (T2SS), protein G
MVAGLIFRLIIAEFEYRHYQKIYPIRRQCFQIESAIDLYKANYGHFPSATNGLSFLLEDEDCRKFLSDNTNLNDPWGTPYRFQVKGNYSVVDSAGPDLKFDTEDDIHSLNSH